MSRKKRLGILVVATVLLCSISIKPAYAVEYSFEDNADEEVCILEMEEEAVLPQDNDSLFEQYAINEFGLNESDIALMYSDMCRDNLGEYEKRFYDIVHTAAEDIADGRRESSIIEISYADLFGTSNVVFSASELEGYDGNNLRAKLAYKIMSEVNSGLVIKALLDDCPYEFYWFDKLVGTVSNRLSVNAAVSDDGEYITINPDAPLYTLKYAVEESYARDMYVADQAKTSAVSIAVDNANAIISSASSKNDYDKLIFYVKKIGTMVSYDNSAVSNAMSGTQTDCDPWQLVYVFDNDPSTNVVCEGYSKAFQYLCDKSSFNGNVYSYIITGYAGDANYVTASKAYAHMWNFVHMDDERTYYMDATWYDNGYGNETVLKCADVSTDTYFELAFDDGRVKYIFSNDTVRVYTASQLSLSTLPYGNESASPSPTPTATPTVVPTATPTAVPTATPTVAPTATPTVVPTPTVAPTATPTAVPTPTVAPTTAPTATPAPTVAPTAAPTATPTATPAQGETMKKINGTWYYYKNGVNDTSYTGMVKYNGTWYYVQKGVLQWGYTGMVKYKGTWYYIQNSTLKWGYTGMVKYNGTWYYVQNSTLKWGYTGMVQYGKDWYYVQNSTLKWGYYGLVQYGKNWYYVQNSYLKWGVTTLVQYDKNKCWYYVNNSKVDFSYNGYYTYNGVRYRIVNGQVK